jgi:hypothetical protein
METTLQPGDSMPTRTTTVVPDRLAAHRARLEHARAGHVGRHVTTLPGLASRLAGGFLRVPGTDELERALQPPPDLRSGELGQRDLGSGGLAGIAMLPGFPRAVASTLLGAWSRGIDIGVQAAADGAHARWRDLRALESAAIAALPPGAVAPPELVSAALERVRHAPTLVGAVTLERLVDVEPVYRPLIVALAEVVPVLWLHPDAVANGRPTWLPTSVEVRRGASATPNVEHVTCADPEHEVREALRWARKHLSEGRAPAELAIATASIATYDDLMHALACESGLPLHAAAGWSALVTPPGQHAAALAELVVRGLDRERVVRFVRTGLAVGNERLAALTDDWSHMLPWEATLNTPERWRNALDAAAMDASPARRDAAALVIALVDDVHAVYEGAPADVLGARWLSGAARALWERALSSGPAAGLDLSLAGTRMSDGVDPAAAIVWAPASTLVGSPRPFTRLLGLAARSWPRRGASDPLLPDHVLGPLAPLRPDRAARDRADFDALLHSSASEVVLSRPRRGLDGRAQAPSPLLRSHPPARDVHPTAPVEHAFSEADRRQARPTEFAADPSAASALTAWRAWHRPELTPHDGLVRRDHPALEGAIRRRHSATSLRLLLRSPLGFVARYALGWNEPVLDDAPLTLDALERGSLMHDVLERAVVRARGRRRPRRLHPDRARTGDRLRHRAGARRLGARAPGAAIGPVAGHARGRAPTVPGGPRRTLRALPRPTQLRRGALRWAARPAPARRGDCGTVGRRRARDHPGHGHRRGRLRRPARPGRRRIASTRDRLQVRTTTPSRRPRRWQGAPTSDLRERRPIPAR